MMRNEKLIILLGPTATGKTVLAANVAYRIDGEIISADSRQVYRGMDIGTGKDYDDYIVNGRKIPCHLIDIAEPGEEYNLFRFQQDYTEALDVIQRSGKRALLCGGTGMYIHSVLKRYELEEIPENQSLREELSMKDMDELRQMLHELKIPHNVTDLEERERLIRAIEIARGMEQKKLKSKLMSTPRENRDSDKAFVFGLRFERDVIRKRITHRLEKRLQEGMVDEVNRLLDLGLTPEQLEFYGLEYRYVTRFLLGQLSYQEMFDALNTAIHQFSKKQMTWFRKMEKEGIEIKWIDGTLPLQSKTEIICRRVQV
jgi:tRNA dimethylallyltransferase